MKTMTMLAMAAALVVPAALNAQTTVQASTRARVQTEARGDEQQARGGADAEVRLAVRAGLPREPVARAAARARARGHTEAHAARAAAEVRTRLQTSHDAIVASGRSATEAEITAGADALAQGAGRADLSAIARRAPEDRQLTASFRALARLGARSDNFSQAAAAIATRLESGTSDRAIGRLAATGSVNAMLRGTAGGLNAGARATGGVSGAAGGVTGTVGGIIP